MNVNDSEKESYDNNSRRKTQVLNGVASASLRALPDNDANSFTDTGTETLQNIIILQYKYVDKLYAQDTSLFENGIDKNMFEDLFIKRQSDSLFKFTDDLS